MLQIGSTLYKYGDQRHQHYMHQAENTAKQRLPVLAVPNLRPSDTPAGHLNLATPPLAAIIQN